MIISIIFTLVVAFAAIDFIGTAALRKSAKKLAESMYFTTASSQVPAPDPVQYPELLQAYLRNSGVTGSESVPVVRMRQKGGVRLRPGQAWKPFEARCFISGRGFPKMVWFADITVGFLRSRSLLRVMTQQTSGWWEKMWGISLRPAHPDLSNIPAHLLLEYCAHAVWHPESLMSPVLRWEESANSVLCAYPADPTLPLSMTLRFNTEGLISSLEGSIYGTVWTYTYSRYGEFQGMKIPFKWTVSRSSGDYPWTFLEGSISDLAAGGKFSWW